jgi:hypothetical protein
MRFVLCWLMTGLAMLAGCGGNKPLDNDTLGFVYVPAWIPYAEEVVIQDPIYAGEEFNVRVRVSSALEPRILRGDPRHKLIVGYGALNPGYEPGGWYLSLWMDELTADGPLVEWLDFTLPALPAGEWQLGVDTPTRRELGGLYKLYELYGSMGAHPDVETRLYPITVIERPAP